MTLEELKEHLEKEETVYYIIGTQKATLSLDNNYFEIENDNVLIDKLCNIQYPIQGLISKSDYEFMSKYHSIHRTDYLNLPLLRQIKQYTKEKPFIFRDARNFRIYLYYSRYDGNDCVTVYNKDTDEIYAYRELRHYEEICELCKEMFTRCVFKTRK